MNDDLLVQNRNWDSSDGAMLWLFKVIFTFPFIIWHQFLGSLNIGLAGRAINHVNLDLYYFLWLGSLAILYSFAVFHLKIMQEVPVVVPIIGCFRIYEGICVAGLLHCGRIYTTDSMPRAILGVLMQYFQVIIAFAILFVYLTTCGEHFKSPPSQNSFVQDWMTPLYFSLITITTVGYGDFSPQTFWGKLAVSAEIAVGIFLLVIILQKAVSTGNQNAQPATQGLPRVPENVGVVNDSDQELR